MRKYPRHDIWGGIEEMVNAMKRYHIISAAASIVILLSAVMSLPADAQRKKSQIVMDFEPVCDTLDSLITARTTVKGELGLKAVMKRGSQLDFYFTVSLGDWPWSSADIKWFKSELKKRIPGKYRGWSIGNIFSNGVRFERLAMPGLSFDGSAVQSPYRLQGHSRTSSPIVENLQKPAFKGGLDNIHIAMWQSHGRYYEQSTGRWEWQRPCLFQTAEDMFTQSFVLPYLVPMLENAGAYVFLPRERDYRREESIVDNDPSFDRQEAMSAAEMLSCLPYKDPYIVRGSGEYTETGRWSDAGTGFADTSLVYEGLASPFEAGTARKAGCIEGRKDISTARWTPDLPEKGEYAVYVSYKSLPESTDAAEYTVRHLGGTSRYIVNQKIGGGTWIYLGTFTFAKGREGYVELTNAVPQGRKAARGAVVTADAVKFGGGMGNIARKRYGDTLSVAEVSGLPRFAEGARYWMQWSGVDTTVYSQNGQKNDYMDDFMSRGAWTGWLSGRSAVNPRAEGKGIPIDLSFGFHSDAGTTPNDSTVGTLAIYTLRCEGSQKLPDGEDRMTCRLYASMVQDQIVNDLRAQYDPIWNRRYLWDRSYSESRTPSVPAMLLELLSHQNFADMRYGLDPAFRFTVSRAVYKGILKYLSSRYGFSYTVQPLPVNSFSVTFADENRSEGPMALLKWKATADTLEPTAAPKGYILYTKIDSGAFDNGRILKEYRQTADGVQLTTRIDPGHIYSFKVTAYNSGGESFPSEILSIGMPASIRTERVGKSVGTDVKTVLVVNNFDRISAPVSFDTPQYAGFDNRIDSGVPYIRDCSFIGEMYQFRRDMPWTDDDNPGFGASYDEYAGQITAGNTFDYPYIHGRAIIEAGYPFCSASSRAFVSDSTLSSGTWAVDLICGKQVTVKEGKAKEHGRYRVFSPKMQEAIRRYTSAGGNILTSGAYIATDIWDRVYEVSCDSSFRAESIRFAEGVLGYRWITCFGSRTAEAEYNFPAAIGIADGKATGAIAKNGGANGLIPFNNRYSSTIYRVESPDGIAPAKVKTVQGESSGSFLRYRDTRISAGTWLDNGTYRSIAIGFPIETVTDQEARNTLMKTVLDFFGRQEKESNAETGENRHN